MSMPDLGEQAASHCQRHGLSYRLTDDAWIGPTLRRIIYECGKAEQPLPHKMTVHHAPPVKPTSEDPKAAAWTKAKTAIDVWSFCLRFDADQRAKETTEAVQSVAQKVVEACAGLEQAVHEPLKAVGEDLLRFQADLHAQAFQNAQDVVTSVRVKTSVPVSGSTAF